MTRKVMTMNEELHPRSETARIYLSRKKWGTGFISCEAFVSEEESNLSWYVRNSEVLLSKVGEKRTVKVDEAKDPKECKSDKREMENKWKEKQMQWQYVRDMKGVD